MKCLLIVLIIVSACTQAVACGLSKSHKHQTYQKPGVAVHIIEPEFIQMAPYSSERVTLRFSAPSEGALSLRVKTKGGLSLVGEDTQWNFDLATESVQLELDLSARETGHSALMFYIQLLDNNSTHSRVFGVPVTIGAPEKKSDASPEAVIMKARESVY